MIRTYWRATAQEEVISVETREIIETALRVHEFNIAEAAETCRRAAEWWSTVHQDTAARWQQVADALDELARKEA